MIMDTLENQLIKIGFREDFIDIIKKEESFESYNTPISEEDYSTFDNEIVSTTDIDIRNEPLLSTNCILDNN